MSADIQFVLGLKAVWEGFVIGAVIMLGMMLVREVWRLLRG